MSFREETLPARDGYELALRIYEAEEPKAVVKFIHGMEEHQDRYRPFAEFLQAAGYTVVTADMRGHGKNAPMLSHIADKDGHLRLLEDEETILGKIHENQPNIPIILFTHSMGTIIARVLLQKHSHAFHKVILAGYPNPNPAAGGGLLLAGMLSAVRGPKGYSRAVDGLVQDPFIKSVPDAETPVDWLSVNRENVERYREDPLCGARFTLGSYSALFSLIKQMGDPSRYEAVQNDLPILLISGRDDPCTGGEKGREASLAVLKKAGFRNREVVTLEGMRHEILNETDREAVYRKILEYINK